MKWVVKIGHIISIVLIIGAADNDCASCLYHPLDLPQKRFWAIKMFNGLQRNNHIEANIFKRQFLHIMLNEFHILFGK